MRREPSVLTLKSKLKMARRQIKVLESALERAETQRCIAEAAHIRASLMLAHLDKDGKFFAALMNATGEKGAEK